MEFNEKDIIEAAGEIIDHSGLSALSIKKLSLNMGIDDTMFATFIKKDEDVYSILFNGLEKELKELVMEISKKGQTPEQAPTKNTRQPLC